MTRLFLFSILVPCFARLCYTDIKCRELEHVFIFALLPGALFTDVSLLQRTAGAVLPFLLTPILGFGDVLLLSVLGFVLGVYGCFETFALASVISGLVCTAGLILKKVKKEDELPFAPYICSACLVLLLKQTFLSGA
jgi:prepilin signal peptidase PulO-like enzyme (type II secretory pathway)